MADTVIKDQPEIPTENQDIKVNKLPAKMDDNPNTPTKSVSSTKPQTVSIADDILTRSKSVQAPVKSRLQKSATSDPISEVDLKLPSSKTIAKNQPLGPDSNGKQETDDKIDKKDISLRGLATAAKTHKKKEGISETASNKKGLKKDDSLPMKTKDESFTPAKEEPMVILNHFFSAKFIVLQDREDRKLQAMIHMIRKGEEEEKRKQIKRNKNVLIVLLIDFYPFIC